VTERSHGCSAMLWQAQFDPGQNVDVQVFGAVLCGRQSVICRGAVLCCVS
jgi:hypothetical protein